MSLIALQGRPGAGKSTMAATMTKLGYHVHYVDMDKKVKSLHNLKPMLEEGSLSYIECPERLSNKKMRQFANLGIKNAYPSVQPKGYLWFCDYIDLLAEQDPEGNFQDTEIPTSQVVPVIDSMSAVNRHLKNMLRYHAKSPKLGFDGWDTILQNYQFLFDALRQLTPEVYPHVIVTIHVRDDLVKDGEDSKVEARPFLDGQFRDELASYLEECYFLKVEAFGAASKPKWFAYTVPIGEIQHARTSMNVPIKIEADFSKIFDEEGS